MKKSTILILALTLIAFSGVLSAAGQASSPAQREPEPARPLYHPAELQSLERRQALASPLGADASTVPSVGEGWSKTVSQYATETNWEIALTEGTTASPVNLTNNAALDIQPRMTRGCTRIVYASTISNLYQIKTLTLGSTNPQTLTSGGGDNLSPTWSPDGTKIAFESYRDGPEAEVYVMNADGSNQTRLTFDPEYDGMPSWSPDGSKIAFISYRSGGYRVWLMNADGSGQTRLNDQPYSARPRFSPDGLYIAFDANADYPDEFQEAWVMRSNGSEAHLAFDSPYPTADALVSGWTPAGALNITHVYWIFYENEWWWVEAYMDLVPNTGQQAYGYNRLTTSGVDWFHDWQPYELTPPNTIIYGMPAISPAPLIVHNTQTDEGGSGVYSGYGEYKDGINGEWQPFPYWSNGVYINNPLGGHTYYFRVRSMDYAGNVEPWPADYDAMTTMESQPPVSRVLPLERFTRGSSVQVSWTGTEYGGSWIMDFGMQFKDLASGDWSDWNHDSLIYSDVFTGTAGHTYAFRSQALDAARNLEAEHSDAGDTWTTFFDWLISGTARDIHGAVVSDVMPALSQGEAAALPSDRYGQFTAYGAGQSEYKVSWSRTGFKSLPATRIDGSADASAHVYLPPGDNLVQNWGFETNFLPAGPWLTGGLYPPAITLQAATSGSRSVSMGTQPPAFSSAQQVADSDPWSYRPQMSLDQAGQVIMVWQDDGTGILASTRDLAGVWSLPTNLSSGSGWITDLKAKIAPDDSLHVVYVEDQDLWYARRNPNGTWLAGVKIHDTPGGVSGVNLAVGRDGKVHITFRETNAGDSARYLKRSALGVWSPVETIPSVTGSIASIAQAITPDGTATALWVEGVDPAFPGVYVSRRPPTGSWSSAQRISPADHYATLVHAQAGVDGSLHAVWQESGPDWKLAHRMRSPAGVWGNTTDLSIGTGVPDYPELVADPDGGLHVAYFVWGTGQVGAHYNYLPPGGSWQPAQLILPVDDMPGMGRMTVTSLGDVHVLFSTSVPDYATEVYYTTKSRYGSWSSPVRVTTTAYQEIAEQILVDQNNRLHIAWRIDGFEANDIYYAYRDPIQTAGESILSQRLQIPVDMEQPTLGLNYWLSGATPENSNAFSVELSEGITSTALLSTSESTDDWQHKWFAVEAWAGKSVTLTLSAHQQASMPAVQVFVDEVSLGSIYPNLMLDGEPVDQISARPGELITLTLQGGNYGSVDAAQAQMRLSIPAGMEYIGANPPPDTVGGEIVFLIGDLPAMSNPFSATVVLRVSESAPPYATLAPIASIHTTDQEMDSANNSFAFQVYVDPTERLYLPVLY